LQTSALLYQGCLQIACTELLGEFDFHIELGFRPAPKVNLIDQSILDAPAKPAFARRTSLVMGKARSGGF